MRSGTIALEHGVFDNARTATVTDDERLGREPHKRLGLHRPRAYTRRHDHVIARKLALSAIRPRHPTTPSPAARHIVLSITWRFSPCFSNIWRNAMRKSELPCAASVSPISTTVTSRPVSASSSASSAPIVPPPTITTRWPNASGCSMALAKPVARSSPETGGTKGSAPIATIRASGAIARTISVSTA